MMSIPDGVQIVACRDCGGLGICGDCGGTGRVACPYCDDGRVPVTVWAYPDDAPYDSWEYCDSCGGSGVQSCVDCSGSGLCDLCYGSGEEANDGDTGGVSV